MKSKLTPFIVLGLLMIFFAVVSFFQARSNFMNLAMRTQGGGMILDIGNPHTKYTPEYARVESINYSLLKNHEIMKLREEGAAHGALIFPFLISGSLVIGYSIYILKKEKSSRTRR